MNRKKQIIELFLYIGLVIAGMIMVLLRGV